jgi:hypothetical protein
MHSERATKMTLRNAVATTFTVIGFAMAGVGASAAFSAAKDSSRHIGEPDYNHHKNMPLVAMGLAGVGLMRLSDKVRKTGQTPS